MFTDTVTAGEKGKGQSSDIKNQCSFCEISGRPGHLGGGNPHRKRGDKRTFVFQMELRRRGDSKMEWLEKLAAQRM